MQVAPAHFLQGSDTLMAVDTHATDAHGEAVETVGAEHHGEGGLPQFRFEYWGGQIVWLLLIFIILYVLLARVFVPRLRRVIDERADTIATAVEQARSVQGEAAQQKATAEAELADARTRSQRLASDARAKAAADTAAAQAAEDAKVAEKVAEAEARIRATRDAAMTNVGAIASETAAAIVAKLTGKAATAAEVKAAVAAKGAR